MNIFLSAGEASGDAHGAALIRALRDRVPDARFYGFGGPAMRAEGMEVILDLTAYDVMWLRAFRHIRELAGVLREAGEGFRARPPDVVVPIDYPGFNLRLAARARAAGVRVVYYISPQVWAWWRGRIRRIARCVDKMLVIFPFEESVYRDAGVECEYVGHPLVGRLAGIPLDRGRIERLRAQAGSGCLVGLLPGSREQELRRHLPVMLGAARIVSRAEPATRFVVPCRNAAHLAIARELAAGAGDGVRFEEGGVLETMNAADLCVTSSGTTTVELMLYGTPMVVMYRVPPMQLLAAWAFMRVPHIAMVNLLAGRRVVDEHLMSRQRDADVAASVLSLVRDPARRQALSRELKRLGEGLGGPDAAARAAGAILAPPRAG